LPRQINIPVIFRCHSGLDPESRIITYRFPLEFIPAKAGTGMTYCACLIAGVILFNGAPENYPALIFCNILVGELYEK
jgi:hypothetical protein